MKAKDQKRRKVNIKKNDQVLVIAGKENGKKGKVLKVFPKSEKIIIEGLNFIKKAQRPTQRSQRGGIIEKEAPIHVSNVMLICSRCSKPTRVGRTRLQDGNGVRVCKKCGEILDK